MELDSSTPRSIIINFLQVVQYRQPAYLRSKELQQTLRDEILSWGLDIPAWDAIIPPSCAMAEMSYSGHSFEQKLLISLFTWFMIYVDDKAAREDPTPFSVFQQRYLASEKQLDPVMDRFAIHLRDMWKHYSAFSANAIVSSAFEFVNGCYLERLTEGMPINPNASRYPYFLRSKTGVAHAYAFMIFPSAQHPDITSYIQAEPSVAYFIDIVNDILSFHKEQLAHETENYVHLRAVVTNRKDPLIVVNDLVEEAITSADGIGATLTNEAKEAWIRFKIGYITFHVSQERYRLSDLGLPALKTIRAGPGLKDAPEVEVQVGVGVGGDVEVEVKAVNPNHNPMHNVVVLNGYANLVPVLDESKKNCVIADEGIHLVMKERGFSSSTIS